MGKISKLLAAAALGVGLSGAAGSETLEDVLQAELNKSVSPKTVQTGAGAKTPNDAGDDLIKALGSSSPSPVQPAKEPAAPPTVVKAASAETPNPVVEEPATTSLAPQALVASTPDAPETPEAEGSSRSPIFAGAAVIGLLLGIPVLLSLGRALFSPRRREEEGREPQSRGRETAASSRSAPPAASSPPSSGRRSVLGGTGNASSRSPQNDDTRTAPLAGADISDPSNPANPFNPLNPLNPANPLSPLHDSPPHSGRSWGRDLSDDCRPSSGGDHSGGGYSGGGYSGGCDGGGYSGGGDCGGGGGGCDITSAPQSREVFPGGPQVPMP